MSTLDHEAYPGKYRCTDGCIAYVTALGGNYAIGYRDLGDHTVPVWWHLDGTVEFNEDGTPKQTGKELQKRMPDSIPVRVRRAVRRWWRGQ